jgi:threonine/homoserine/homoserine lactone efflux protein
MIFKGFKFGMLLQFAIGPVCIFVFQVASLRGFYIAETAVSGVSLIDGIFIGIATLGIGSVIDKKNVKIGLRIFGAIILFVFGLSIILNQFNIIFLPSLNIHNISKGNNAFSRAMLITFSNPLTIIFWTGVFSAKLTEKNMDKNQIYLFGFGALLSTVVFLSLIDVVGSFVKTFLSYSVIQILNLMVGVLFIYFSVRMLIRRKD